MHTDAHVRMAGNASPAFAGAWKLFLDSTSGTHRAHFVCFPEINASVQCFGNCYIHFYQVVLLFQVGDGHTGRNLISVIPHWLEMEIH